MTSPLRGLFDQAIVWWGDSLTKGDFSTGTNDPVTRFAALASRTPENEGVHGETSTQIAAREVAGAQLLYAPTVIWAGRNNFSDAPTVEADVASMVAALHTSNYLVLSVVNGEGEGTGTTNYNEIVALNADLATTYGAHYVDVREALVALYDPGQPGDVTDHANDIPPASLRADTVHYNDAGYNAVAGIVYAHRSQLGIP